MGCATEGSPVDYLHDIGNAGSRIESLEESRVPDRWWRFYEH
jgi:hypothetical protein